MGRRPIILVLLNLKKKGLTALILLLFNFKKKGRRPLCIGAKGPYKRITFL